ncbi:MAG: preprotein translocase subunit SecY [Planctomycetota bacterium]|nr:MAG: preprotein translocase subunit SecY [Planctomycetota bacterium]
MLQSMTNIFRIPELRRKVLYTFAMLIVYRLGFQIWLPGVDIAAIEKMLERAGGGGLGQLLAFASAVTGGALQQAKLFSLGIMPYISASIIFSLLVKVIPSLEALQKEGESGRRRINELTRYATVGLCLLQSLFVISWLKSQGLVIDRYAGSVLFYLSTALSLTAGAMFVMWIGERISESGVGNGISLIIMAGIIARLPGALSRFATDHIFNSALNRQEIVFGVLKLLAFLTLFVVVVVAVVIMQQSQRRIPIQQQKHTRGRRVYGGQLHYLPFRVNSAGVMPVIFAQSLLMLPAMLLGQFMSVDWAYGHGFWGITLNIALIYFFTYFWISLQFNPVEIANNMKEHGSFIPGIRPGRKTAEYLEAIMNRITFVGAGFLCAIAVLPNVVSTLIGIDTYMARFLGGTGILIIVGVALDIVQKIESHLLMRHYEGFIKRGKIRARRGGTI